MRFALVSRSGFELPDLCMPLQSLTVSKPKLMTVMTLHARLKASSPDMVNMRGDEPTSREDRGRL